MNCFVTLQKVSLCLILCFGATKQEIASKYKVFGQRKEFGCLFESPYYLTNHSNTPIWEKQPSNGVYIKSDHKEDAPLSPTKKDIHPHERLVGEAAKNQEIEHKVLDAKEWDRLKSEINQSFALLLETHTINDVNPFIIFIKQYNNETMTRQKLKKENISFESFFDEYDVPYGPRELDNNSPAGLIIHLFKEIQRSQTGIVKLEPYLVSAYIDPPNLDVSNVQKGYEDLTKTRFQEHVGGVIQIYYENRLGYILFEPGYYNTYLITPFAVVLMADGNSPHGEFLFGNNLYGLTFTMGDPKNMFVVATYTKRKEVKNVVYYLGRAYCSFLESTNKGGLLRSEHGIVSFDSSGLGLGHFSFNIKVNWEFLLGQWMSSKTSSDPVLFAEDILFKDLKRYRNHALERHSKPLFLRPEQLGNIMTTLMSTFFDNPQNNTKQLQDELTTLSNKYNLEKRSVNYDLVYTNATQRMKNLKALFSKKFSQTFNQTKSFGKTLSQTFNQTKSFGQTLSQTFSKNSKA